MRGFKKWNQKLDGKRKVYADVCVYIYIYEVVHGLCLPQLGDVGADHDADLAGALRGSVLVLVLA